MKAPSDPEFIGRTLQRLYRQIHNRLINELHGLGYTDITPSQAGVLSCIMDGSSIVVLAKFLGITKQATGELVRQLEGSGYVTKSISATDARSYTVKLDERGIQLIRDATRLKEAIGLEYCKLLGEKEFKAFVKSLKRMSDLNNHKIG